MNRYRVSDRSGGEAGSSRSENGTREERGPNAERETPKDIAFPEIPGRPYRNNESK